MPLQSGLCGLSLVVQCCCIGSIQSVSSFSLLIIAAIRIGKPQSFIANWEELSRDPDLKNSILDNNDETAIELMVAAGSTFIASLLLLLGMKQKSTSLIYPWIIITVVQLVGGIILFCLRATNRDSVSQKAGKIFAVVFYYALSTYFLYCVSCYYNLLKKQKRLQRNALNLDFRVDCPLGEMNPSFESSPCKAALDMRSDLI